MDRQGLIEKINAYLNLYPEESAVVSRFVTLLDEHSNCFDRDCWFGHITGSSWIVHPEGGRVLLTHHKKLGKWLQPGGHSDGDEDTLAVALREAIEETSLQVEVTNRQILDLDIHEIPARKNEPAHLHYDIRFAIDATTDQFQISEESVDLAWVRFDDIERYTTEESVLRMLRKWHEWSAS